MGEAGSGNSEPHRALQGCSPRCLSPPHSLGCFLGGSQGRWRATQVTRAPRELPGWGMSPMRPGLQELLEATCGVIKGLCAWGGGKGGNPMTLGSLLFPGLLDRLGVQSPQEAILGGSPSPPASSRRSPEADPSPGPQATPKGHQLGVTVPRRSREGPPMRFKLYPHPMLWGPVPVTIVLCMARRVLLSA